MEKLMKVVMWIAVALSCAVVSLAQQAHIVEYSGSPSASDRPDFTKVKAYVAFDRMDPKHAIQAEKLFRESGMSGVSQGAHPCDIQQTIICVWVEVGQPVYVSGSGYISEYGGRGGYNSGSTFSGNLYPVVLHVDLIRFDTEHSRQEKPIPLAYAQCTTSAGYGSSYGNSYDRHDSGSFYSQNSGGLDIGVALRNDINALLGHGFKKLWSVSGGATATWYPGANDLVQQAFEKR